ncbi:MAG TPA: hypothetical protein VN715_00970 [Roseiarcus sp.]|nr:hypothetical protein [Roseiarcus sp.]
MPKITIDLDDRLAERLATVSCARNLTVEEWLRVQAEQAAPPEADFPIENSSHRAVLASLDRPEGYYESPCDEIHDRELARAEAYIAAREVLLELIDNTQGDMGAQVWNRGKLYEP